jgi:hypothetical protein
MGIYELHTQYTHAHGHLFTYARCDACLAGGRDVRLTYDILLKMLSSDSR